MKPWLIVIDPIPEAAYAVRSLAQRTLSPHLSVAHKCAWIAVRQAAFLPLEVRERIIQLQVGEIAALLFRSLIDVSAEGVTPEALPACRREKLTLAEAEFLLVTTGLGHPYGWTSIQHGSLINDVHPVPEHGELKRSSGYKTDFGFHTEDSFHPFQEHFLALMCIRNDEQTPTILASVDDVELPEIQRSVLSQPRYSFPANVAHDSTPTHFGVRGSPILNSDWTKPYLRVNFNQPMAAALDEPGSSAITALKLALDAAKQPVVLNAGDVLFLDNYVIAHGRDSYIPANPGRGRWLKRIYVTANHRCLGPALCRSSPFVATS
jgi:L-asparagine oxygenase